MTYINNNSWEINSYSLDQEYFDYANIITKTITNPISNLISIILNWYNEKKESNQNNECNVNEIPQLNNNISKNVKLNLQTNESTNEDVYIPSEITNHIIKIKEDFESLSTSFGNLILINSKYEEEYYLYESIKDMALYILDDIKLIPHINSITNLLVHFNNLLKFKEDLNHDNYLVKLDEFDLELMNYEQNFYTKICTPSENYDKEVLSKITNSLLTL